MTVTPAAVQSVVMWFRHMYIPPPPPLGSFLRITNDHKCLPTMRCPGWVPPGLGAVYPPLTFMTHCPTDFFALRKVHWHDLQFFSQRADQKMKKKKKFPPVFLSAQTTLYGVIKLFQSLELILSTSQKIRFLQNWT
jgi:hypothetical protein